MADKRLALIVANSEYQDPALTALSTPLEDAKALAHVLQDPAIGNFEVQILLNQPSSKLSQRIEEFFIDRQPDDLVLFYFSGHGFNDEDGMMYFAGTDTKIKLLQSTAVGANFLNNVMSRSRARSQIVILDCSFADAFRRLLK